MINNNDFFIFLCVIFSIEFKDTTAGRELQGLLLLPILLLSSIIASGQSQKYVSSKANLEFTYPPSLKPETIENAPHMLLKLTGRNIMLSLSFFDYGYDETLDSWNEEIFSQIKSRMALSSAEIISLEKVTITIDGRSVRAIEIIGNEVNEYQGRTIKSYYVIYQIWYKGNMIQILYYEFGSHYKNGSEKGRALLKGLKLK